MEGEIGERENGSGSLEGAGTILKVLGSTDSHDDQTGWPLSSRIQQHTPPVLPKLDDPLD